MHQSATQIAMIGCGKLGTEIALGFAAQGYRVWGCRRRAELVPKPLLSVALDLTDPESLDGLPVAASLLVYCLTPDRYDDIGYCRAYPQGLERVLDWYRRRGLAPAAVFISSTSVYHQRDGSEVDEDSRIIPEHFSGRRLLEAEQALRLSGVPGVSVRFGGIYGPTPGRLVRYAREGLHYPAHPPIYTNRIHQRDAVGVVLELARRLLAGEVLQPCYLGVDCAPTPRHQVMSWLRERLGVTEMLGEISGGRSPGSKRCSNARLRELGFAFRYPDYRAGYTAVLATPERHA